MDIARKLRRQPPDYYAAVVRRLMPREELVELRLGGPDKLVLQVTELYYGGAHYEVHATL